MANLDSDHSFTFLHNIFPYSRIIMLCTYRTQSKLIVVGGVGGNLRTVKIKTLKILEVFCVFAEHYKTVILMISKTALSGFFPAEAQLQKIYCDYEIKSGYFVPYRRFFSPHHLNSQGNSVKLLICTCLYLE